MKLIDELQERRERVTVEMIALAAKRDELLHEHNVLFMQRDDIERAIAALTPAPIVNTDEGWELEPGPAELFEAEKAEAREQLEREDDASEFAEPMLEAEFVVLDEKICEPVEEAPALEDDHIVEPQPTDGYAHVVDAYVETTPGTLAECVPTNPDADADRNKFSPWGIFGKKLEEVS